MVGLGIMSAIPWANRCLSINLQKFKVKLLHLLWTIKRGRYFLDLLLSYIDLQTLSVLRMLVPYVDEELMHLFCEIGPE